MRRSAASLSFSYFTDECDGQLGSHRASDHERLLVGGRDGRSDEQRIFREEEIPETSAVARSAAFYTVTQCRIMNIM